MEDKLTYVLITAARNEADLIELTIKSVVAQTVLPVKWVIVDDGSTDNTGEIVTRYAAVYPWIELVQMPERGERHFAGKAFSVKTGRERLNGICHDVVGNLDADVSFDPDYFEFLMARFAENAKLGVAGTAFLERNRSYNYEIVGIEHVSGMIQMFRRECFEATGGYASVKSGGIDVIAVLTARTKGWETRTFTERFFVHHRSQGGALHTGLAARWQAGRKDYLLGNHPVWEFFRSFYQMRYSPYLIGGLLVLISYCWQSMLGVERTMPPDLMELRQGEQMKRLKSLFERRLHLTAPNIF
jgi:glycosyltransferase involved in cell wall biosynthesis